MNQKVYKLGTRNSPLALYQANFIKGILESSGMKIDLVEIKTKGDKILDAPLSKIGGKGLFTKELDISLLNKEIDFAVHSLKDVPVEIQKGLKLISITKRANPFDYFISIKYKDIFSLPLNAKVGTTSLRRSMQLKHFRQDLDSINLRGNIQTRLNKLESSQYDGIIMAGAAIGRMELMLENSHKLDFMLPAMGQGALGIECREIDTQSDNEDRELYGILESLNDTNSSICCKMERYFIAKLNGGCQSPIAVYVNFENHKDIRFRCAVGDLSGNKILKKDIITHLNYTRDIDIVVEELKNQGIQKILDEVKLNIEKGDR